MPGRWFAPHIATTSPSAAKMAEAALRLRWSRTTRRSRRPPRQIQPRGLKAIVSRGKCLITSRARGGGSGAGRAPRAGDYLMCSLVAPRRTDPATGAISRSAIKVIGRDYSLKTMSFPPQSPAVAATTVPRATEKEIKATVHVMGGTDRELWV